jgi:hypothetical protein
MDLVKEQRGKRERYEEIVRSSGDSSAAIAVRCKLLAEGRAFAELAADESWIGYWRSEQGRLERSLQK